MKTLDQVRTELWKSGQKYAKACRELGLSEEMAIEKYINSENTPDMDNDTLAIVKCSIAFGYI